MFLTVAVTAILVIMCLECFCGDITAIFVATCLVPYKLGMSASGYPIHVQYVLFPAAVSTGEI